MASKNAFQAQSNNNLYVAAELSARTMEAKDAAKEKIAQTFAGFRESLDKANLPKKALGLTTTALASLTLAACANNNTTTKSSNNTAPTTQSSKAVESSSSKEDLNALTASNIEKRLEEDDGYKLIDTRVLPLGGKFFYVEAVDSAQEAGSNIYITMSNRDSNGNGFTGQIEDVNDVKLFKKNHIDLTNSNFSDLKVGNIYYKKTDYKRNALNSDINDFMSYTTSTSGGELTNLSQLDTYK